MKKRIAVVLSGGGFSGFWPMLGAAIELDRRHDVVAWGGTSAGAIVAAVMATGVNIDDLVSAATDVDLAPRDVNVTQTAVKSPAVLRSLLRRFLPDRIGDVKTRLKICTSNLTTARAMVWDSLCPEHAWAPLPDVVLASTAIPFAFPPVKIGKYHHVDGGITHNLLADAFPLLPVVGVTSFGRSHKPRPSGWWARLLWTATRSIDAALASNIREDIEDAERLISLITVPRAGGGLDTLWRINAVVDSMAAGAKAVATPRRMS